MNAKVPALIPNLVIAGYRSFGGEPQIFECFAKINLFIGRNNSGKSNVLSAIARLLPQAAARRAPAPEPHLMHDAFEGRLTVGILRTPQEIFDRLRSQKAFELLDQRSEEKFIAKINARRDKGRTPTLLRKSDGESAFENDLEDCFVYEVLSQLGTRPRPDKGPYQAFAATPENATELLFNWPTQPPVVISPSFRSVDTAPSSVPNVEGTLIESLARLQNPSATEPGFRKRFSALQAFVRQVLDEPDASIEVQHDRKTINVGIRGRFLPLNSLGSGTHQVLMIAALCTLRENTAICLEEPELHLNPLLQKKLIRFLAEHTQNQYFIATHSASFMDEPDAEIYHVRQKDDCSVVQRVTSDSNRTTICADLGYSPSDFLIANCVIWVEGPSDRIYLNWWINASDKSLIEGIHYSVMFYGGRLSSHLTFAEPSGGMGQSSVASPELPDHVTDFINLRRLNPHAAILLDSDKRAADARISATKERLLEEFSASKDDGFAWLTKCKEIENYIPFHALKGAIQKIHPNSDHLGKEGTFEDCLELANGKIDKIRVAREVVKGEVVFDVEDLRERVESLVRFIRHSNPPQTAK